MKNWLGLGMSPQPPLSSSSSSTPPLTTANPSALVMAITQKIASAPTQGKDAKLPIPAEFATGSFDEKMGRLENLAKGLADFLRDRGGNVNHVVHRYAACLEQACSALKKTSREETPRPPTADVASSTSPLFSAAVKRKKEGKRPASSPPAIHATPKRCAGAVASTQSDENNNEAEGQGEYVLVNHRRQRQRNPLPAGPTTAEPSRSNQPARSRLPQRRIHHRPDAIIIKAKDASTYADILRKLKAEPTLQATVGSSVQNIRRSAAGALVLQLKKDVNNASTLGAELGKVLGDVATASAQQHTTMIEIKDLDECTTKEEIAQALGASLEVPELGQDVVKTLRMAYAGTQVAAIALTDDLAAKALKLGHIRIGWVNCRIRGREEAPRCYRCWSFGHVSSRCKGPDRSGLCYRCGLAGHQAKDCKGKPACVFCQGRGADHGHASTSQLCPLAQKYIQARRS